MSTKEKVMRLMGAAMVTLAVAPWLGVSPAGAEPKSDPPGFNGTVKIHDDEPEPSPVRKNQPHVCDFHVHGFNFDAASSGTYRIDQHPPTGRATVKSGTWTADSNGDWRTEVMVLPDGHYKLYVDQTLPEAPGGKKHKVFWVRCGEETSTPTPSGSISPSGGGRRRRPVEPRRVDGTGRRRWWVYDAVRWWVETTSGDGSTTPSGGWVDDAVRWWVDDASWLDDAVRSGRRRCRWRATNRPVVGRRRRPVAGRRRRPWRVDDAVRWRVDDPVRWRVDHAVRLTVTVTETVTASGTASPGPTVTETVTVSPRLGHVDRVAERLGHGDRWRHDLDRWRIDVWLNDRWSRGPADQDRQQRRRHWCPGHQDGRTRGDRAGPADGCCPRHLVRPVAGRWSPDGPAEQAGHRAQPPALGRRARSWLDNGQLDADERDPRLRPGVLLAV